VFFETLLADRDPPLFEDVRRASVLNLAAQYHPEFAHTQHVAELTLEMWDALAAAGKHAGDPAERDLLWAAAMLHDIGTAVDYDDHHKHSRYLILNARLPGFTPRELYLIALIARYHRKGEPDIEELGKLARKDDERRLSVLAGTIRLAEQLERSRDQSVRSAHLAGKDGVVRMTIETSEDVSVAVWAAERNRDVFAHAFGRELEIVLP
jgi:exopolyphosphatase/guanosine-5'-triphosphate,3'-diphosphate pyrophosphatase